MEPWLEAFARANFRRSADTAHDLKTPLNVAVLNLELLRMRVAKVADASKDEKVAAYAAAIEAELRRMARIFDTFFLLSTPPKGEEAPVPINVAPIWVEVASAAGYQLELVGAAMARAHHSRIRQGLKMFFEGASNVLKAEGRDVKAERSEGSLHVTVSGQPAAADFELTKILKFYYTDPLGNPDLSLAAARLIAETYGGELNATQERDKVTLRLSLPLGDQ
jgi:signal transduction histidine kinase